ncbi:FAD-binding protein [Nonomuraea sp. MTCD27]|uniref:FAD-binding protein n=1 Tax=Nonomuraea sp. MTCD27 TaxID=1676747 RepID=UPI0035C0F0DB
MEIAQALLTGFGRTAPTRASVARPRSVHEVAELLAAPGARGVIARGLGSSYGDAAQCAGGLVIDCTGLPPFMNLDRKTGLCAAGGGVTLDALMRALLPHGWFVPVTPGTRRVTVGGAVAADVHGKNHHVDGSMGHHVRSLTLVLPGGEVRTVTPDSDPALFWATVGGMGLTGVITEAVVQCVPVETSYVCADTERTRDLDHMLEVMAVTDAHHRYSVAWIDLTARGRATGRGVLTRGRHARRDELPRRARKDPLAFAPGRGLRAPGWAPPRLLNRLTVGAFNEAWYRKAPGLRRNEIQGIGAFFHPLDGVRGWNALYGPRGLVQYQFVVPFGAEEALREAVARLSGAGVASFLAVLKRFGPGNPAPMSFPMPGWTLALDLPAGDPRLGRLLAGLDELVAGAGGRVYLAKDSRLPASVLARMYPRLPEWNAARRAADPDGLLVSDLARRLSLADRGTGHEGVLP